VALALLEQEKTLVEQAVEKMKGMTKEKGYFKNYIEHFEFWKPVE
jgi:hypothetical protein